MCDRYVFPEQIAAEREFLPAKAWWRFSAKFNVAAQQYVPATRVMFGLAAVWDRSEGEGEGEDGDVMESCSVIRVAANDLLAGIANSDALMPAILRRRDYETWLRGTPAEAKMALQPYQSAWMQAYAVSPRINSTALDDAGLIQPVY